MLVEIQNANRLKQLESKTGIPANELVNQILDIHLDENKKSQYLLREINKAFDTYKSRHNMK